MDDVGPIGRARGGAARAEVLSPERRTEIARLAAAGRWKVDLPQATHESPLPLGGMELQAAVLEDGRRLLLSRTFLAALGRPWKGTYRRTKFPNFIDATNLSPFITKDLEDVLEPVEFRTKRGQKAIGYRAELLPEVIDVYLKARAANKLRGRQKEIADQAEILGRGLMRLGIVGLVDEVTGYQEVRDRDALQEILNLFLRKELAAWAKRFPDEFYRHIYRLRGWAWKGRGVNPPQVVAHYTKDIVYARLAPGIMAELEKRNPIGQGRRKSRHHQYLTDDVGHPALAQHLHAIVTLMRISQTWGQFMLFVDQAHPRRGDTLQLPLMSPPPIPETDAASIETNASLPLFEQSPYEIPA